MEAKAIHITSNVAIFAANGRGWSSNQSLFVSYYMCSLGTWSSDRTVKMYG